MKKRSVLYTWVIEFSILLILMATMCVTLTLSARRKLLDEYTEITIQQQEKIETALNNSMSQIKTDAINLACNNVIRSFSLLSTPMPSDNYTFYTIQSLLAAPGSTHSAVSETYIYFRNLKKALTSKTVYEKETLAAILFGPGGEVEKRFDSLRTTSSLFRVISDSTNGRTQVMAVTSIPTQGRSPTALIIQVLDPQALGEIVAGQATMEGTTTLLMDSSGQLLCESGNPALAGQLVQMAAVDGVSDGVLGSGHRCSGFYGAVELSTLAGTDPQPADKVGLCRRPKRIPTNRWRIPGIPKRFGKDADFPRKSARFPAKRADAEPVGARHRCIGTFWRHCFLDQDRQLG